VGAERDAFAVGLTWRYCRRISQTATGVLVRLTITAAIQARWGHRVDGLIHTHAWSVEATLEGPADRDKVFPADDLERVLSDAVAPWHGHYLTAEDIGEWKGYRAMVWDREPTVEEIVRRLWKHLDAAPV